MQEPMQLNRQLRRKLEKQKKSSKTYSKRKRRIAITNIYETAIANCQPITHKAFLDDMTLNRVRLQNFKTGEASSRDFDELALRLNMLEERCKEIKNGEPLLQIVRGGQRAMDDILTRYLTMPEPRKFSPEGDEFERMDDALSVFEAVAPESSRIQLTAAWNRALAGLQKHVDARVAQGLPPTPTPEHP